MASNGGFLKDLDLRAWLLKHQCSYMIYSTVFKGLPRLMKERIYTRLAEALNPVTEEFAYLPSSEKQAIRTMLTETVPYQEERW